MTVWAPSRGELYYRSGDKPMAAGVTLRPTFQSTAPTALFEQHYYSVAPNSSTASHYDVSPDGQRFVMIEELSSAHALKQIGALLNWPEAAAQAQARH